MHNKPPYFKLWCAFFAYTAAVALFVQLVALPYLFPQWHAGDGLLVGGDWLRHHRLAVELAQEIHSQGWKVWTLRPEGQAPAGIAGAIYALTVPKPWTLIPLNAALHATATLILLRILLFLIVDWRKVIWAVLPFFLYPSTAQWTTQILKDGYSILGFFLFLYGWLVLTRLETWQRVRWRLTLPLFSVVLGGAFIWLVRPYLLQILQGVGAMVALLLTIVALHRAVKRRLSWPKSAASALLVWGIVASLFLGTQFGGKVISAEVPTQAEVENTDTREVEWQNSTWAPAIVEDLFYSLALVRDRFITLNPDAASNVDVGVEFKSASDVIAYLPRATQIAFFAPFPPQWFESGSLDVSTFFRRVSAFEMIGVYIALLFLPYAVWRFRRQLETWIVFFFCVGTTVFYGLVTANIGTLYRFRYPFLMTLVACGIAGGIVLFQGLGQRVHLRA